jgi:hypothetical protein
MLPGPNYIYACPNCGNLIKKASIISGNTFNSRLYSDGKRISPMLPEFPDLTKCAKCDSILWLRKLKAVGKQKLGDKNNLQWQNADEARFLTVNDCFVALNNGLVENDSDALFVRRNIWWAYNDRERNGENLFENGNDEIRWRENCTELIKLLDQSDLNQRIMIAEIKRNLGDFEGCLEIVKRIEDEELNWLKDIFIMECGKGNRSVIKVN